MEIRSTSFTNSDLIAAFFSENGVPAVFELSGGMIAFLTDAIARLAKTPIINMRHEQAAAHVFAVRAHGCGLLQNFVRHFGVVHLAVQRAQVM